MNNFDVRMLPKISLHDHLDGGLRPQTIIDLAAQVGHELPTTDAKELAKVAVAAEILEHTKGPKIRIHKFKNKTGYHKRQGHRQPLTVLKVTGIK